jgi:hypothetical protein
MSPTNEHSGVHFFFNNWNKSVLFNITVGETESNADLRLILDGAKYCRQFSCLHSPLKECVMVWNALKLL